MCFLPSKSLLKCLKTYPLFKSLQILALYDTFTSPFRDISCLCSLGMFSPALIRLCLELQFLVFFSCPAFEPREAGIIIYTSFYFLHLTKSLAQVFYLFQIENLFHEELDDLSLKIWGPI